MGLERLDLWLIFDGCNELEGNVLIGVGWLPGGGFRRLPSPAYQSIDVVFHVYHLTVKKNWAKFLTARSKSVAISGRGGSARRRGLVIISRYRAGGDGGDGGRIFIDGQWSRGWRWG